ncbi:hypothetical protein NFI96_000985 [Prochilodus magdalenae]|nr:hypothetical protein NFI96_000985 [Prochilodus magdalenae]
MMEEDEEEQEAEIKQREEEREKQDGSDKMITKKKEKRKRRRRKRQKRSNQADEEEGDEMVDKLCGQTITETHSVQPTTVGMVPTITDAPPFSPNQSHPPAMDQLGKLSHLRREFMNYIGRYKSFFAALPEMLCEGEVVRDEFTCWSGDDVVERNVDGEPCPFRENYLCGPESHC